MSKQRTPELAVEESMSAADLSPSEWLAVQNAVSNDGDLDDAQRLRLVDRLGDFYASAIEAQPIILMSDQPPTCGDCGRRIELADIPSSSDEDGPIFEGVCPEHGTRRYQDEPEAEDMDCGQCEGTGTTDAMGHSEPCPVCDATGRIPKDD